jgi:predicted RNA binding protein YcfA (HicA-like mRNA interferase family)
MNRKPVKAKHLVKVLEQLGFVSTGTAGNHSIFRHRGTGLVITIPVRRGEIPSVYLRAIERQIGNFNIVPEDRLQKLLYS